MSVPNPQKMVLDFDGWLADEQAAGRNSVARQLDLSPDRAGESKTLTNQFWLSSQTGMPVREVIAGWDKLRPGFAERLGFKGAHADDAKFYDYVRKHEEGARDESKMIEGVKGVSAEAKQAQENSLLYRAYWSAAEQTEPTRGFMDTGVDMVKGYAAWSEGKPQGFQAKNAGKYWLNWATAYQKGRADLAAAHQAAQTIVPLLQTAGAGGAPEFEKVQEIAGALTQPQQALMMQLLKPVAGKVADGPTPMDDMGTAKTAAFASWQMLGNMLDDAGAITEGGAYENIKFKEGQEVPAADLKGGIPALVKAEKSRFTQALSTGAGGTAGLAELFTGSPETVALTKEQAAEANAYIEKKLGGQVMARQLRNFAQGDLATLKTDSIFSASMVGASQSLPVMGLTMIPGNVGTISVLMPQYAYNAQLDMEEKGVPRDIAKRWSFVSGAAQAFIDKFQAEVIFARIPGLQPLKSLAMGSVTRAAVRTASTVVIEGASEVIQNPGATALTQQVAAALNEGVPGPDWTKVMEEAWAQTPENLLAILPWALLGTGGAHVRDFVAADQMARDPGAMKALGFSPSMIAAVVTAPAGEGATVFKALYPERVPVMKGDSKGLAFGDAAELVAKNATTASEPEKGTVTTSTQNEGGLSQPVETQAKFSVSDTPATEQELNAAAGIAAIRRDDNGWHLIMQDGKSVPAGTAEAALHMRESLLRASTEEEAGAMVQIADEIQASFAKEGKKSSQTFTPDRVEVNDGTATKTTPAGKVEPYQFNSQDGAAELNRELSAIGTDAGLIQGSNWIAEDGTRMMQTNQTTQKAVTQIHEFAESRFRPILESSPKRVNAAAVALVNTGLFDPARQRTQEDADFAGRVQAIADGTAAVTEARETMVELLVGNWLSRRKDGTNFAAGSVSAAVEGALRSNVSPSERQALGWFRSIMKAMRAYLRGVFGVAAKLQKARRDGKLKEGDDFSRLADEVMGLSEQRRHTEGVIKELAKDEAFSLASGMSNPPGAAQQQDSTPPGGLSDAEMRQGVFIRSIDPGAVAFKERDQERSKIEGLKEAYGTKESDVDWDEQPKPVISYNENGDLMVEDGHHRISAWRENGFRSTPAILVAKQLWDQWERKYGVSGAGISLAEHVGDLYTAGQNSYQGGVARDISGDIAAWQNEKSSAPSRGADLKPAQDNGEAFSLASTGALDALAAQFENTKLPPEKRLKIYEAIAENLRGMSRAIKFNDANNEAVSDLENKHAFEMGAAREDGASRAELEKLELRQRAEMKALEGKMDRKEMLRSLQAFDAMLIKLPSEIRGKIGGFVKLASLTTDKAREKFLKKAVGKMETVLEDFLADQYNDRMQALVKKAEAKAKEAGKKPTGNIGADAHSLISAMGRAMEMNEAEMEAELAKLDSLIAGGTLTAEQEALAMRERELVNLAGDWKNTDAAGRAAAWEAAESTYAEGYLDWAGKIIAKRERRENARASLQADTGKAGTKEERQERAKKDMGWKGKLKDVFLGLSSFREGMEYVFGPGSKTAQDFTDRERKASNAKEDAIQDISDEIADWFTKTAGSPFAGTQLQWRLSQSSIDAGPAGKLSEMQAIQALQMWAQKDGQRHMEAFGYDKAWADDIASKLSPEGRAFRQFLRGLYDAEYAPLNKLYRERHGVNLPSHDNYAPLTVKPMQAKAGEIVDPVTGGAMSGSLLTPGSLRTRSRVAEAEPEFRDALQTYLGHVRQLEHWKAYYDLATDMQAVLGNRDVSNSVEAKAGEQAAKVLQGWTAFFGQGGNRDAAAFLSLNQTLSRASGRAAEMILFGRVGTLLVQSTQLGAALAEMPTGAYISRLGKLFAGKLAWGDAIKSGYIQRRFSQAPPVVRQAMDALNATEPTRIKHAAKELGKLIAGADALFTAGTYAITLDYHRKQGEKMGLTGAELEQHAHTEAERSTDRVAQPTRGGARSLFENTSTGALARIGWAFASESRQKIALAAWAARTMKSDPAKFARTVAVVWGAGGLASALIRAAWRDAKDDDDDEVFDGRNWSAARISAATAAGPLQGIPGFGEMLESWITTAAGGYNPNGDLLSQAGDGAVAAKKLLSGKTLRTETPSGKVKENPEWAEDTLKAAKSILFTMGLFNDTLAAANSLANVAEDGAKVVDNLNGSEKPEKKGAK